MRTVAIGVQDFEKIRKKNLFYVDKTDFVCQWWENNDDVTLITRPRRFGKTLTMDMCEKFFSVKYAGRSDLFEGLEVWKDAKYRELQGTYPVIFLSFADIKGGDFEEVKFEIAQTIQLLYRKHKYLLEGNVLEEEEKQEFRKICEKISEVDVKLSLQQLSNYMCRYYGKKVIILLDEYDTPMQEAYVGGYWEELTIFFRKLFNATFKTNQYLERALMTGITRVSKESIFSGLNNLKVVTTTSKEYAESFGFTEEEVFAALDEYHYSDKKNDVKAWYDGFSFGSSRDIYNPWSIINYLDTGEFGTYWANTSSNSLIGKLIQQGNSRIKWEFECLMRGDTLKKEIDEQIVYNQLDESDAALWSLLLASGYLKIKSCQREINEAEEWEEKYELELTNFEVKTMFRRMIKNWFGRVSSQYNSFVKALLAGAIEAMNVYMNKVALETFSYFDTGKEPSEMEPERFYHGFVLGLLVELNSRYVMLSNHESGLGRYDVMLEPRNPADDAYILEFKVMNSKKEKDLTETVQSALKQIGDMKYETSLTARGIPEEKIHKYGFAFQGKKVLIGE